MSFIYRKILKNNYVYAKIQIVIYLKYVKLVKINKISNTKDWAIAKNASK